MADHSRDARHFAHLAQQSLSESDAVDPAQRAHTYALLALTHAVLSTGEDVGKVSSTLIEMEDVFRGH